MKINSSWKIVSLGDLAEKIDYGLTASATDVGDGPKFLRITDIQDDQVNWSSVPLCECSSKDREKYVLGSGDIVFARTGATTGKSFLIQKCPEGTVFASYLIRVRAKNLIDPAYLVRFFQTPSYWQQITQSSTGTAQAGVNATRLKQLSLPLPPLDEQRRIAAILDKADGVRRKRREAIRLTEELLRSQFLEMFGDPVTNPKGWEVQPLEDVIDFLTRYPFKSKNYVESDIGIKLCRGANVLPDEINWNDICYWNRDEIKKYERFLLKQNDVVIAMDRPWISSGFKISVIKVDDLPSLLVQRVARLRAKDNKLQNYLYFLLCHHAFEKHCHPTETTVPHISSTDIKTFPIPIPNHGLLEQFNKLVAKHEEAQNLIIEQHKKMEELFNSLLQRAFRGDL